MLIRLLVLVIRLYSRFAKPLPVVEEPDPAGELLDRVVEIEVLVARRDVPYKEVSLITTTELAKLVVCRGAIFEVALGRYFWEISSRLNDEVILVIDFEPFAKEELLGRYSSPALDYDAEMEIGDMEAWERDNQDW